MRSLLLLADAFGVSTDWQSEPLPEEAQPGVCCLLGEVLPTIARRHLLTASFTDTALLQRPDSDRVSVAAWVAFTAGELRDGKSRRYCPERMSSWRCVGQRFLALDRQGVRAAVLGDLPAAQWAGYATTSYKKHGSLRAPVNTGAANVWLWETRIVDCSDRAALLAMWDTLRRYQDAGIPRPVLETAELDSYLVAKIGIRQALEYERWARPRVNSALYQFIVYLLPSKEELDEQDREQSPAVGAARKVGQPPARGETSDLFA